MVTHPVPKSLLAVGERTPSTRPSETTQSSCLTVWTRDFFGRKMSPICVRPRDFCLLMSSRRHLDRDHDAELACLVDRDTDWLFLCPETDLQNHATQN